MYPVQVCAISFLRFDEMVKNHRLAVNSFDQAFGTDKKVAKVDMTVLPNKH